MLPLQQAYEVKHSLIEYLKATFRFKDKGVHDAFYNFITHPEEGIFKGPYVSLKLPFVTVGESAGATDSRPGAKGAAVTDSAAGANGTNRAGGTTAIPLEIAPTFPPYHHQMQAFERLTTKDGHKPQSTLVTTGTSSGKTECFLFPILDYCHKHTGRKGIKVIILYPMNALATDQAKRMAETHIIENRTTIIEQPPDIPLTNFKTCTSQT